MKWISSVAAKQKPLRIGIILAGISLILLFLPFSAQELIGSVIQTVFYSHFYGVSHKITDLLDVYEINRQLKATISQQRLELTALREYEKESKRLRELLGFKESYLFDIVPAEIVALDPKRRQNAVIAEIGPEQSAAANLPVVNVDGLVGKTTSTLGDLVTVELLTSPNCRAAARDANTRVLGIVRWAGGQYLQFDNVSLSDSVSVGDTVITSGLGGIFPENLPIGTISSVKEGKSPFFKEIEVDPFVYFGALDELIILTRSGREG